MFGSISIAPPNSIVTSSFTATRTCIVGITESEAVRVNGQVTTDRILNLVTGDKIELDVMSGEPFAHKFIPWTFNGNPCYFAVASSSGSARPTLKSMYRNLMWYDFTAPANHTFFRMDNNGSQTTVSKTYTESSTLTWDLVSILDPLGNYTYFCSERSGTIHRRISHPAKPLSHTRLFNGATQSWETYVLLANGLIDKIVYDGSVTRSTTPIVDAKCIFSDGVTLFVGGVNKLCVMGDFNNVARTVTLADTIISGAALGPTVLVSTSSGRLLSLVNSTLTQIYISSMIPAITVFKDVFLVAVPEAYNVKVYDKNGTFVRNIETGGLLPMAIGASRTRVAVSFADSTDVWLYPTGIDADPVTRTFNQRITYAMPISDNLIGSNYLASYDLTIPPNPVVSGLNWPRWKAPVNVDTGTGEYAMVTIGENLLAHAAPNATLLVDGDSNLRITTNRSTIGLFTRSYEGTVSTAVAVGNYAFDFIVDAEVSDSFTTTINVPPKFYTSQVVYDFVVPAKALSAPLALTHGTLRVNGSLYNGRTPVKAGDSIRVTLNLPQNANRYWSLLTLADSQFSLVMSTAVNKILDTKRFIPYGDATVESTITVEESGRFLMPTYSNVKVVRDDAELAFPIDLVTGDVLTIRHVRASQWWMDDRDTVLMGPTINHIVRNTTLVDDAPDYADFGLTHMGIPDFETPADNEITISGLSDGFSVEIYSEFMRFSVNGSQWVEKPLVKNGDKVRALYRVKNLFETMWAKVNLAQGNIPYEWGELNIDPALGEWMPPRDLERFKNTNWMFLRNHYEEPEAADALELASKFQATAAATPRLVNNRPQTSTASAARLTNVIMRSTTANTPLRPTSANERLFAASTGGFVAGSFSLAESSKSTIGNGGTRYSPSMISRFQPFSYNKGNPSNPLYNDNSVSTHTVALRQELEAAFGVPASYTKFTPLFQHESTIVPLTVPLYFVFRQIDSDRNADTIWDRLPVAAISFSPTMQFEKKTFLYRKADTYWDRWEISLLRWKDPVWLRWEETQTRWKNVVYVKPASYTFVTHLPGTLQASPATYYKKLDTAGILREPMLFKALVPKYITGSVVPRTTWQGVLRPVFADRQKTIAPAPVKQETLMLEMIKPVLLPAENLNWHSITSVFDSEKYFANNDNMGGFATEEEAAQAAEDYTNILPVQTYRQPEGTFGFVIKRETALFCELKGTNIYAIKWLIGGG